MKFRRLSKFLFASDSISSLTLYLAVNLSLCSNLAWFRQLRYHLYIMLYTLFKKLWHLAQDKMASSFSSPNLYPLTVERSPWLSATKQSVCGAFTVYSPSKCVTNIFWEAVCNAWWQVRFYWSQWKIGSLSLASPHRLPWITPMAREAWWSGNRDVTHICASWEQNMTGTHQDRCQLTSSVYSSTSSRLLCRAASKWTFIPYNIE